MEDPVHEARRHGRDGRRRGGRLAKVELGPRLADARQVQLITRSRRRACGRRCRDRLVEQRDRPLEDLRRRERGAVHHGATRVERAERDARAVVLTHQHVRVRGQVERVRLTDRVPRRLELTVQVGRELGQPARRVDARVRGQLSAVLEQRLAHVHIDTRGERLRDVKLVRQHAAQRDLALDVRAAARRSTVRQLEGADRRRQRGRYRLLRRHRARRRHGRVLDLEVLAEVAARSDQRDPRGEQRAAARHPLPLVCSHIDHLRSSGSAGP